MFRFLLLLILFFQSLRFHAQTPKTLNSAEILMQLKKLNVLGSVLFIAAHPDDENTRLLAYLANEKLYRTGYLSMTRGDGGQNLIGDEQGVALGLIRTQELLSARRMDGAEQFFTRAYDFGFCKSSAEALATWGHDKILSDVVQVIRTFQPDVIITRFPEDNRAGHGHHSASAILTREAFAAAADSTKFPDQLCQGVGVWQARRLLWNTYNFGSLNTQDETQYKEDVGMYNPLLGKSYGEIAALSRSQHKSQGFGVPAQRGNAVEYFETIKGEKPSKHLMDGIDVTWKRLQSNHTIIVQPIDTNVIENFIDTIIHNYSFVHPELSVPALVELYKKVATVNNIYWKKQKLKEIENIIKACSGLFLEAAVSQPYLSPGDTLKISLMANNQLGVAVTDVKAQFGNQQLQFGKLQKNVNTTQVLSAVISAKEKISQPYWLQEPMDKGSFNVAEQKLIGKAENDPLYVDFMMKINDEMFAFSQPIQYKYTDPVNGEVYQPVYIVPKLELNYQRDVFLSINNLPVTVVANCQFNVKENSGYKVEKIYGSHLKNDKAIVKIATSVGKTFTDTSIFHIAKMKDTVEEIGLLATSVLDSFNRYKKVIEYDHIPRIVYFPEAKALISIADLKTKGNLIGYIAGAGDKIPDALLQMGYKVIYLTENDITATNLTRFDALITGIRAYNIHPWLTDKHEQLMQYIKNGGVLLVQYNTNNSIAPLTTKIGPYPFAISRNRITDENATVNFLLPKHSVMNYPNKITEKDFNGWIQERSIYNAENMDTRYSSVFGIKDPGENEQKGSLIIADYGRGKFVYTGLVFFRELPAGNAGAYRLFANLIAQGNHPGK